MGSTIVKETPKKMNLGECSICFDDIYTDGQGKFTPRWLMCAHVYHQSCISKWFKKSSICPLCSMDHLEFSLKLFLKSQIKIPN
jgi:hypothetical protein